LALAVRAIALTLLVSLVPACGQLGRTIGNLKRALALAPPPARKPTGRATGAAPAWVICLDWTASYPASVRRQALHELAGDLSGLAYPGSPGATVWVRKIVADSFSPTAELFKFSAPAIPPMPPRPVRSAHPLDWRPVYGAYRRSKGAVTAKLQAAQAGLARDAQRLLALRQHVAYSSDIWGCISAASQLLAGQRGARNLVLITDGRRWGGQQILHSINLASVQVRFVDFLCRQAAACSRVMARWTRALTAEGATSVSFFRPESDSGFFGSRSDDPRPGGPR
jgi:hypothetical protein